VNAYELRATAARLLKAADAERSGGTRRDGILCAALRTCAQLFRFCDREKGERHGSLFCDTHAADSCLSLQHEATVGMTAI
jgi:hypothetical protein